MGLNFAVSFHSSSLEPAKYVVMLSQVVLKRSLMGHYVFLDNIQTIPVTEETWDWLEGMMNPRTPDNDLFKL